MISWEWKKPAGREDQPYLEFLVEEVVCSTVLRIAMRAHRRGDDDTVRRMVAITKAGAAEEKRVRDRDAAMGDFLEKFANPN